MNAKFFYYWIDETHKTDLYYLMRGSTLTDAPEEKISGYNKYLLSALDTDYPINRPEFIDEVLKQIEQIELEAIDEHIWEGDGFLHTITRQSVTFEHYIFGICPEWPLWTCPLLHYKLALEGWREFIQMPKDINTQLIVELPLDVNHP